METKINIAAILKDKPQGTKLYDWLHNIDVELDTISTTDTETVVWCTNETNNNTTCHRGYSEFGTERGYPDGLQILLPSKDMRDWSKFFKKGDVLICYEGKKPYYTIFDGFEDNTYRAFKGKFAHDCYEDKWYQNEGNLSTNTFQKLNRAYSEIYVTKIEERFGGKLNRETLEIEKPQPEFKEGDIAFADYGNRQDVFIVSGRTGLSEGYSSFISMDLSSLTLSIACITSFFKKDLCKLRLATEEEKQQLFDALAKEGNAWDAEKKMIVNLKPKVELKPFDNVLVRHQKTEEWRANIFSHTDKTDEYLDYVCVNGRWEFCIPYEGNESLLGTTKDVEG